MSVRKVVATPAASVASAATPSFQILTVQQVANLLQVSPTSIYEMTRYRRVRNTTPLPHRKIGRYLRFEQNAVVAWFFAQSEAINSQKRAYSRKRTASA